MRKKILNIDTEVNVGIIGICCVAKDYRLCWEINKQLKINLTHQNNKLGKNTSLEKKYKAVNTDKTPLSAGASAFGFKSEENGFSYKLVSNTNELGEKLIPEQKQVDYFMLIEGVDYQCEQKRLTKELRKVEIVLTAFDIPATAVKTNLNIFISDS